MKRLEFNDFEDFAYSVSKMFQDVIGSSIYNDIAIIAKYEEARQIIKYLIQIGYDIHNINLNCKESNMYDDEYIVSLCKFDDEECIWCEPLKNEDGYLTDNSTVAYVLDNCSSKLLKHLDSKCIFEVGICEDDEECDCDECECSCKKDEKPSTTKSEYFINGKSVDKSEFDRKYEEFEEMYLDNIRDMLLNYCSFMDEMNEWRSRFLRW